MMRYTFFLTMILLLSSCHSQPDTLEIKKCIKRHYDRISLQDGSGVYSIESISLSSIVYNKSEKHWVVDSEINGTYSNPSIPNRDELNKPFKENRIFVFKKNREIWQCELKLEE